LPSLLAGFSHINAECKARSNTLIPILALQTTCTTEYKQAVLWQLLIHYITAAVRVQAPMKWMAHLA
jgi:hypothetical protein